MQQRSHSHSVRHDGGWVWSHASGRGCELHSYGGLWGTEMQTERAYETHSSGESMGAARAYLLPMMKPNTMKTRMIVPATATTAMMMTGFCSLDMTVAAIKRQINNTRCQIYSCKFVYKIQEFCIPVFYKRNFVLIFHAHFPHFFSVGLPFLSSNTQFVTF